LAGKLPSSNEAVVFIAHVDEFYNTPLKEQLSVAPHHEINVQMSDTQSVTPGMLTASATTLEEAYAEWDKAHAHIKSVPPTQERDYIKHAANLLTLLEPVAEISPIAKGGDIS
jgi:hypothetical protein